MKHLRAKISLKKQGEVVTVIASDESLDRHGEVLPIESWDLSKFKGSPRMLVDHDHRVESIVGKWVNVRIEGKQLMMDAQFHGITELSKAVEQMVNEGYLDTVSVGFISSDPTPENPKHSNELIETSWVTVPANPNARLVKALEMPVSDEEKAKLEIFKKETDEPVEIKKEDEVKTVLINSVEEYIAFKADEKNKDFTGVNCSAAFIEKLIDDSEKLKTLTESKEGKVELSKALKNKAFNHAVLKEMARNLNGLLHNFNKVK